MTRFRWILVGLGCVAALGAGAWLLLSTFGSHSCSKVGCSSQTNFSSSDFLGPGRIATFCVNEQCTTRAWEGPHADLASFAFPDDEKQEPARTASVSIDDGTVNLGRWEWSGEQKPRKWKPNGSDCPPTCYVIAFTLRDNGLVPMEA